MSVAPYETDSPKEPRLCEVLFFAGVSDLAKTRSLIIPVQADHTFAGLRADLVAKFPRLKNFLPLCALAGDGMIASDADKIGEIQVIAVLPPVSGG